jgi:hypothetical protein
MAVVAASLALAGCSGEESRNAEPAGARDRLAAQAPADTSVWEVILQPDSVFLAAVEFRTLRDATEEIVPVRAGAIDHNPQKQAPLPIWQLAQRPGAWRAPTEFDLDSTYGLHSRFFRGRQSVDILCGESVIALMCDGRVLAVTDGKPGMVFYREPLRAVSFGPG